MSIRLRLALWYGGLFALILLLVGLMTYALHVRGHYDDRDRLLITSAAHIVTSVTGPQADLQLHLGIANPEVLFAVYAADGTLRDHSPEFAILPPINPQAILAAPAGPAFDTLATLAPPLEPLDPAPGSAFGLLRDNDQRWRLYVLPFAKDSSQAGALVALTPLGHLDMAIQAFRLRLLLLGVLGLLAAVLGGWAIAGRTLRPIDSMVRTARTITQARDLSHRLHGTRQHDEVGRLAETLNAMLDSLEESMQLQQRFVADASHELRAPLTVIQGNLELLRHQTMTVPERDEILAEVETEAARLTRLVADLLVLARADAGGGIQQQIVDLDALVLDTFQATRPLASGHSFRLDPLEPVQVLGDADRLRQLIVILLDNALKYTPADGQVTLGLRAAPCAELSVQDNGVGISAADLPHVFERFYRADPARGRDPGGTGLGLAIAHWIVTQHHGSITLQSSPDGGVSVLVRLPLAITVLPTER